MRTVKLTKLCNVIIPVVADIIHAIKLNCFQMALLLTEATQLHLNSTLISLACKTLFFCCSSNPLFQNRHKLKRNCFWQSLFILFLKRLSRYNIKTRWHLA